MKRIIAASFIALLTVGITAGTALASHTYPPVPPTETVPPHGPTAFTGSSGIPAFAFVMAALLVIGGIALYISYRLDVKRDKAKGEA